MNFSLKHIEFELVLEVSAADWQETICTLHGISISFQWPLWLWINHLAAAPISIKNSSIWLFLFFNQSSSMAFDTVFASSTFSFLCINTIKHFEILANSSYKKQYASNKIPEIKAKMCYFAVINKSWWWITKMSKLLLFFGFFDLERLSQYLMHI